MKPVVAYIQNEYTAHIGNSKIEVRNLVPKMTEEQRNEAKKKIQNELYSIFYKYMS